MKKLIVNAQILGEAFGVTARHVNRFVESGMPREGVGRFDFSKCLHWYLQRMDQQFLRKSRGQGLAEQEARIISAQARIMELRLEKLRSALVSKSAAEQVWASIIEMAMKRLATVPREMVKEIFALPASERSPGAAMKIMTNHLERALQDLSVMDSVLGMQHSPKNGSSSRNSCRAIR